MFPSFSLNYDVSCRFVDILYQVEEVPLYSMLTWEFFFFKSWMCVEFCTVTVIDHMDFLSYMSILSLKYWLLSTQLHDPICGHIFLNHQIWAFMVDWIWWFDKQKYRMRENFPGDTSVDDRNFFFLFKKRESSDLALCVYPLLSVRFLLSIQVMVMYCSGICRKIFGLDKVPY